MSGVRIYDLAKELNVSNNEILDLLKAMGEPARTASSTLPDAIVATVRAQKAPTPAAQPGSHHAARQELQSCSDGQFCAEACRHKRYGS